MRVGRRADRRALRRRLGPLSGHDRLAKCGRSVSDVSAGVTLRLLDGVAHYSGLQSCGSIWVCPVCAPRIREERAREIEAGLASHFATGGSAGFLTLTLPHDQGDALGDLLDALMRSWGRETGSRGWRKDRQEFGVIGFVRSTEVTCGPNGWHPHLHVLLLTETPLSAERWEQFAARIFPRWERAVVRAGYRAPERHFIEGQWRGGLTVSAVRSASEVASYTSKVQGLGEGWGAGREVARHDLKLGRSGRHRAPFQIARDAVDGGEAADVARWCEYVRGMHGRRAIEWSRGLRDRLGLGEGRTDEEIAAEEIGGEVVLVLSRDEWGELYAAARDTLLLELVEASGDPGSAELLLEVAVGARAGP